MATLQEVQILVINEYNIIRSVWYSQHQEINPAIVQTCIDLSRDSGYYRETDIIAIRLSDADLNDSNVYRTVGWPPWRSYLVHEMLHEFQYKIINESSEEGRNLYSIHQTDPRTPSTRGGFGGEGHDEIFYTAITLHASYFNITPEELFLLI